ncbi:hypothetical protein WA171_002430 [Blastocystis sp. BT1]
MRFLIAALCVLSVGLSQVCQIGGACVNTGSGETTCRMDCSGLYDPRFKLQLTCTNNRWEVRSGSECVPLAPSDFSYASNDLELMQNKAMNEVVAYVKCAECEFLVKDADLGATLPEGINIDSGNGTLSGTPTKLQDRIGYTLIARNKASAVETVVYIKVVEGVDGECKVGEFCTNRVGSCQADCGEGFDPQSKLTLICESHQWKIQPGSQCIGKSDGPGFIVILVIVLIVFFVGCIFGMIVSYCKRRSSHLLSVQMKYI